MCPARSLHSPDQASPPVRPTANRRAKFRNALRAARRSRALSFSSARRSAAFVAAAGAALLWAFLGSLALMIYGTAEKEARNVARDTAFMVASYVNQTMKSGDLVLEGMRSLLAEQGITDQRSYETFVRSQQVHATLRDRVANMQEIDKAAFISTHGKVLNFSFKYPVPPIDVSDRDYFREQMTLGAPSRSLGMVALDRGSGKSTFYVARRLLDANGMVMGVAIVGFKADFLSEFFANTTMHRSVAIVLQRNDGAILTGSGVDPSAYGRTLDMHFGKPAPEPVDVPSATIMGAAPDTRAPAVEVAAVENPPGLLTPPGARRYIAAAVGVASMPAKVVVFVAEQVFLSPAVTWCVGLGLVGLLATAIIGFALRRWLRLINSEEVAREEAKDRRLLSAIVNTPSALTAVLSQAGRIIQANDKFWNALSAGRARAPDVLAADHVGGKEELLAFAAGSCDGSGGNSREFELQVGSRTGKTFLHLAATRQNLANVGPCVILVGHDETDRLNFQAALAHSARLVTLGELATGVAHELNQPLFAVSMSAENALADIEGVRREQGHAATPEGELIERLGKNLCGILVQVKRAARIVQNMRMFGRAGNEPAGRFDIREACQMALDLTAEQLRRSGVTVRSALGERPVWVHGVRNQLEQVLINVLINARDAVAAGGGDARTVELAVGQDADTGLARINIRDSGAGVPEDVRTRIFDPFFTTKGVGCGVGLGLSISYGIMRDMGGAISLVSSAAGADFQIDLKLTA